MTFHHTLLVAFAMFHIVTTIPLPVSGRQRVIPHLSSTHEHGHWENLYNLNNVQPGKNYKGLSNVKKYLHQFGYIPNTPLSNLNDDFDDTLVSAIRTFQTYYKLNVTGELDDNTLQLMVRPRCGVPDVEKQHTSAKSSHFHAVEHYAFLPNLRRWPAGTQNLTFGFRPEDNLNNEYKNAIQNAFNTWTPVVKIAFWETSFEVADIEIAFFKGEHGDGAPFDGPAGILAHASSDTIVIAGKYVITSGSIHIDADEYWVASGDVSQSPVKTAVDLETMAVHEIGHVLGLAHSSDLNAVMYAYADTGTKKVLLSDDDIQGIRELYGFS